MSKPIFCKYADSHFEACFEILQDVSTVALILIVSRILIIFLFSSSIRFSQFCPNRFDFCKMSSISCLFWGPNRRMSAKPYLFCWPNSGPISTILYSMFLCYLYCSCFIHLIESQIDNNSSYFVHSYFFLLLSLCFLKILIPRPELSIGTAQAHGNTGPSAVRLCPR